MKSFLLIALTVSIVCAEHPLDFGFKELFPHLKISEVTQLVENTGKKCIGDQFLGVCCDANPALALAGWFSNDTLSENGEYSF